MTSHGMMFQAPEVMNVHQSAPVQITAKTDLYLLGLLILYVCLLHSDRASETLITCIYFFLGELIISYDQFFLKKKYVHMHVIFTKNVYI